MSPSFVHITYYHVNCAHSNNKVIALSKIFFFFFNDTATTEIYTLSLHDALPICRLRYPGDLPWGRGAGSRLARNRDRKSTRLNSSHSQISYAVFCLKKKKTIHVISHHLASAFTLI